MPASRIYGEQQASPVPCLPYRALAVAAILCAQTSVLAIAEWGARQPRDLLQQLGFSDHHTLCQSTVHRVFQRLDSVSLAQALSSYFHQTVPVPQHRGAQGIALDGKAQRGCRQFEAVPASVQTLTAFCHDLGVVLVEEPLETGVGTVDTELVGAPRVIAQLNWQGRVLTAGTRLRVSLYCQRSLCQPVLDQGGDYLLTGKANQPTLSRILHRTFDPQACPLLDRREGKTVTKGHGRSEIHHLRATADSLTLPEWPGIAQLGWIDWTWWDKGTRKQQVRYAITSLPPAISTAHRLLALKRKHWLIENRGHRAKDMSLGRMPACSIALATMPLLPASAITVSIPTRPSPCSSTRYLLVHKPHATAHVAWPLHRHVRNLMCEWCR